MASGLADDQAIVTLLAESIETDLSPAGRLTDLLSRSVPWQFPGRLLEVLTAHVASVSDAQLRDGVLAVEFSALHQYLHSIALSDGGLIEPASSTQYATDTVAALLDGDLLQARAFSHLGGVVEETSALAETYRRLSATSVSAYEQAAADISSVDAHTPSSSSDRSHRALELAPLAGVAATIAGRLRSAPDSQARSLERAAVELGFAVPIQAPTGRQPPMTTEIDSPIETIETVVGTPTAADIAALVDAERRVHPYARR